MSFFDDIGNSVHNTVGQLTSNPGQYASNPMNWVDPLGVERGIGGAALGQLTGQGATDNALADQTAGANAAMGTLGGVYHDQQTALNPYMQAGTDALTQIKSDMPSLTKSFSASDFTQDPGYQFRLDQANNALQRSAAASGSLGSGATMKALTRYSQDFASNEFNNAYNRFTNDQNNRFGKLTTMAGVGQNATGQLVNAGGNYGNGIAGIQTGLANAQASAQIAQANRQTSLINGGMQAGGLLGAAYLMSDERLKTNVEPVAKKDLAEFRRAIRPYKFNYINDKHGEGDWVGIMAQDLEKSKLGRMVVFEDKDGYKKIDTQKLMSLILASMAEG